MAQFSCYPKIANSTTLGQALMAASLPVAIASDQSAVPVSGTVTVTAPLAVSQSGTWNITNVSGTVSLPTGAATESTLSTLNGKIPSNLTVTSTRLLIDGSGVTQPVSETTSSTGTITSVSGSATSISLLASNASRKNAAFFNESAAVLYLKLGATASITSYTIQIPANGYYELPVGKIYTGAIDGIWASAAGAVRITELT